MFGYIKPFKPELRIREFETYKAVYCGLCSELGKAFGFLARFALSYDFTFLNMICEGVTGDEPSFITQPCCVNPLKKVKMRAPNESRRFSADIAALMIYYKILDNIRDGAFPKKIAWAPILPLAGSAYRKAAASRPEAARVLSGAMERQREVEASGRALLDEACEPSAAAVAGVFALMGNGSGQKRILERMGYLIGRYIYICDALDDFDSDIKHGSYNPLVLSCRRAEDRDRVLLSARQSLYMTAGEIVKAQALLNLRHYGDIADNIIGMGLRACADEIYCGHGKNRKFKR